MEQDNRLEIVSGEETGGPNMQCIIWEYTPVEKVGGDWEFFSKRRTQMMSFLLNNNFSEEDYGYYIDLPQERLPEETFLYYKCRNRFKKALEHYRSFISSVFMMKKLQTFIEQNKQEKELKQVLLKEKENIE